MDNFKLGQVVVTQNINSMISDNKQFAKDITIALQRYVKADFSEMDQEDIDMNTSAIKNNNDRIFASYKTCEGEIWIITEWDRSVTTLLFPSEY